MTDDAIVEADFEEPLDEEAARLHMWDQTDQGIMRSVHAYLMWHSGSVFRESQSEEDRTVFLDMRADEAEMMTDSMGIELADRRRVRSMLSLATQVQHEPGDSPICYLDIELISHQLPLPFAEPAGFSTEPIALGYPHYSSYSDFKQTYADLAYYIQYYPTEVAYQFQRLQKEYLTIADYRFEQAVESFHFIPPEWHILGAPCNRARRISQLNMAYDVGQIVSLRGQVVEISEPKTTFTDIAWKCRDSQCRTVHFVEQDPFVGTVKKPDPNCGAYQNMQLGESNNCTSKHFIRLQPPMSNAVALQRVTLQEEELTNGEARSITLEVRGSLTESLIAGQGIEVTGVLLTEPIAKGSLLENKFVLVKSVNEQSGVINQVEVTESDRTAIQTFREENNLEERMQKLAKVWAGRIYAADHIKHALLLQNCGATRNEYSDTRGCMHILIVGDPGTAKSKLLELNNMLHPASRFVSADQASQAGLTGACAQIDDMYTGKKKWALLPGDLGLTPEEAVCCIDEFNLYKGDFGDFNNAMESGYVYISKVVKGRINTRAGVCAGANPNNGNKKKWLKGEQVPYAEQIGLDFTILQRFDAIFVLEDEANYERDRQISLSMTKGVALNGMRASDIGEFDLSFVQKYLAVCRETNPMMDDEARNYMADNHASKRQKDKTAEGLRSHRQVNALTRFTLAVARFDGAAVATMEHVRFAEGILKETLEEKDPGVIDGGLSQEDLKYREEMVDHITLFFQNLERTDLVNGKKHEDIHRGICESMQGWRKPGLAEMQIVLDDMVYSDGDRFQKAGDTYYYLGE